MAFCRPTGLKFFLILTQHFVLGYYLASLRDFLSEQRD